MAAESVEQRLAQLYTLPAGTGAAQIYARGNGLTISTSGETLEQLVRVKLTANGKSAQLRESLLATIRAGGAVGESVEECLLKSGLIGWS